MSSKQKRCRKSRGAQLRESERNNESSKGHQEEKGHEEAGASKNSIRQEDNQPNATSHPVLLHQLIASNEPATQVDNQHPYNPAQISTKVDLSEQGASMFPMNLLESKYYLN